MTDSAVHPNRSQGVYMKKAGLIKGINTAGQALHPAPVGAFRGKPRGIKPCFDCARSVMSEQARPRLSLRLSIIWSLSPSWSRKVPELRPDQEGPDFSRGPEAICFSQRAMERVSLLHSAAHWCPAGARLCS